MRARGFASFEEPRLPSSDGSQTSRTREGGENVRWQKTDADFAASQHLFRADNFTGNWTKANSRGLKLLFTGRLRVSLPAVKEHQPVMRRSFCSDNNRGKI